MEDFIKLTGFDNGVVYLRKEWIQGFTTDFNKSTVKRTEVYVCFSDSPFVVKETPDEIAMMIGN